MKKKLITLAVILGVALAVFFVFFSNSLKPTPALNGVEATPELPRIAILVPGHGGNQQSLQELSQYLEKKSWQTHILDIGSGKEDLNTYGELLKQKITEYHQQNLSVNVVGYSAGGIITRIALADPVVASITARAATVASPHKGTKIADIGEKLNSAECGTACRQMSTESDLLSQLPNTTDSNDWLSIFIDNDEAVRPAGNATLDGATNINLSQECPDRDVTHSTIIKNSIVANTIENFFYTGEAKVLC